jgi:hypothetical protein
LKCRLGFKIPHGDPLGRHRYWRADGLIWAEMAMRLHRMLPDREPHSKFNHHDVVDL